MRDTTSSHLLEAIISRCPDTAFDALWNLYLGGKLPRLAVHPVANFVVARALERVNEKQLSSACQELGGSWSKLVGEVLLFTTAVFLNAQVASSRLGVLRAIIDRAFHLQALGDDAINVS